MDQGQRDFEQAWKRLTTQGDAGGPTPLRDFAPVGLRKDVRETGPLYHGTQADLQVGDFLHPGFASNYGSGRRANFVYVTAIQAGAALAAELAQGPGEGRVYLVEPTGPLEDDPNVTDRKFPGNPSRSYRAREPVRIVGEVQGWERLPPQVLEKLRERMREAARLGVEAIND